MIDEMALLKIADITVNEYAWLVHVGALVILFFARKVRDCWWMLLLSGFFLLTIGLMVYATVAIQLGLMSVNSAPVLQMQFIQNIMLMGYGAIGVGLVTVAVTMPSHNR